MAPITRVKTYSRTKKTETNIVQQDYNNLWDVSANNSNLFPVTSASRAIDSLLAKNVEKRDASFKEEEKKTRAGSRKSKRLETAGTGSKVSPRFLDVSINLRINSTFDNLLQGPKYRSVHVCNASSLCGDSSVENSYPHLKKIALSPIQNPKLHKIENYVETRRTRKKKNEVIAKGKIVKKNTGKKLSKIIKNIPNISSSNNVPKKLYSYLDESINHSLIIERVKRPQIKKSISDHSSYNCARKFTPIIATAKTKGMKLSSENDSFNFPRSFRRCMQAQNSPKYSLLSSTPLVPRNGRRQEEFAQWSPITAKSRSRLKFSNSNISLPTNKSANNKKNSSSVVIIDSVLSENESFKTKNNARKRNDLKLDYTPVVKLDKSLDILGISGHLSLASLKHPSKTNKIPKVYFTRANNKIEEKKQHFSPTVNLTRYSFSAFRKIPAHTLCKRSKIRKIPNVLLEKLSIASFLRNPKKYVSKTLDNIYSNKTDGTKQKVRKNTRGRKVNNKLTSTSHSQDKKKKVLKKKKQQTTVKTGKRRQIISDSKLSISTKRTQRKSLNCTAKSCNTPYNCSLSLFDDQSVPIPAKNPKRTCSKTLNPIEIIDLTDETLYPELKMTDDKMIRNKRGRPPSIIGRLKKPNNSADSFSQTVQTTAINNKPKLRVTRSKSVSEKHFTRSQDISSDLENSIPSSNNLAKYTVPTLVENTSTNLKNNSFDAVKRRSTRSASVSVNSNDSKIVSSTFKSLNSTVSKSKRNHSNNLFDTDNSISMVKPKLRKTRSYSVALDSCNDLMIISDTSKSFNNSANDSEGFKIPKPIKHASNSLKNNSLTTDTSPVIIKPRLRMTRSSSVSLDSCNASKIDNTSNRAQNDSEVFNTFKVPRPKLRTTRSYSVSPDGCNSSLNNSEGFKVPKPIKHTSNNFKNNSFTADTSPVIIKPRLRVTRSSSVFVDSYSVSKIDKSILSNSLNRSENDSDVLKVSTPIRKRSDSFINNSLDDDKSLVAIKPRLRKLRSSSVYLDTCNTSKIDNIIVSNTSKSLNSSASEVFKIPKFIKNTSKGFKKDLFDADNIRPRLRTIRSSSVSCSDDIDIDKNTTNDSKGLKVLKPSQYTSNSIITNLSGADKSPLTIKPGLRITRSSSVSTVPLEASNTSTNNSSTFKNKKIIGVQPRLRITRASSVAVVNRDDSNMKNGSKLFPPKISVSDVLKSISFDAKKTLFNTPEEFVDFESVVKEFVINKPISSSDNFVSKRKNNVQFDINSVDKSTKIQPSVSLDTWENFSQRRNDISTCGLNTSMSITENGRQTLFLKAGKQWFRSLSMLRHTNVFKEGLIDDSSRELFAKKGRKWRQSIIAMKERQNQSVLNASNSPEEISNHVSYTGTLSNRRTTLQIVKARSGFSRSLNRAEETNHEIGYVSTLADESILESLDKLSLTTDVEEREETARQIVLRRCGQTLPVLFDECYSQRILTRCRKIGEGVYGEVFMYKSLEGQCRVMKVIPIEGDMLVNGEQQKKFDEIISEIVIASELSNLRTNAEFCTDGFNELLKICCVKGKYPQHLLDLWELYDEDHGSENDSPQIFTDDQLYIVLELANGGQDLEAFRFKNAEQSYAVFIQVVCSLAVAEAALEFEHRDMHWGNILICSTDEPTATFRLNGREFEVATRGVKVSIIDFTLSRMTFNNCCIFNDLALDADLFSATGDYQFDIYRLMQQKNLNEWQHFEPHSNVLWLDYTLEKMITQLRYVRVNSKTHKNSIRRLSQLKKNILDFNSATQFLNSDVFSHVFL